MPDDDDDLDEPIPILKELEQETSPAFLNRLRGKIDRRLTASQVISFSWQLPKTVIIELARMFGQVVKSVGDSRNGR